MPTSELVLLGTIHSAHLRCADYHLGHLKAVFGAVRPDLLMVEIRPKPFRKGRLADGPLEMAFLVEFAREAGVAVAGVDWFLDEEPVPDADPHRLGALHRELESVEPPAGHRWPLSYLQCHDMDHLRYLQTLHRIRVRHLGDQGHGRWMQRTLWIGHRVTQALAAQRPRRALLAMGVDHVADLLDLLATTTNSRVRLSGPIATPEPETARASAAQLRAWRDGIEDLRQRAAKADDDGFLRKRLAQKLHGWERAVQGGGVMDRDDEC